MHQPLESGMDCKICGQEFSDGPEHINLCRYKEGFVHLDCCRGECSMHGEPCCHSIGVYEKV